MVTGRHGVDPGRPWVDPGSTPSGNLLGFALPYCRSHPRTSYLLCLGVPPLRHDARSRTSLARVHGNADQGLERRVLSQNGYGQYSNTIIFLIDYKPQNCKMRYSSIHPPHHHAPSPLFRPSLFRPLVCLTLSHILGSFSTPL